MRTGRFNKAQKSDDKLFLLQKYKPSSYIKYKNAHHYFDRLDSILCKEAAHSDPQSIVRV